MEKLHFTAEYPAEEFDIHNISDPLGEVLRSKSKEHGERLITNENFQKITKSEENKR